MNSPFLRAEMQILRTIRVFWRLGKPQLVKAAGPESVDKQEPAPLPNRMTENTVLGAGSGFPLQQNSLLSRQVDLYGFGADSKGNWHHYWENNPSAGAFRQTGVHSGDFESNMTLTLASVNKIHLFMGRWPWPRSASLCPAAYISTIEGGLGADSVSSFSRQSHTPELSWNRLASPAWLGLPPISFLTFEEPGAGLATPGRRGHCAPWLLWAKKSPWEGSVLESIYKSKHPRLLFFFLSKNGRMHTLSGAFSEGPSQLKGCQWGWQVSIQTEADVKLRRRIQDYLRGAFLLSTVFFEASFLQGLSIPWWHQSGFLALGKQIWMKLFHLQLLICVCAFVKLFHLVQHILFFIAISNEGREFMNGERRRRWESMSHYPILFFSIKNIFLVAKYLWTLIIAEKWIKVIFSIPVINWSIDMCLFKMSRI